MDWRYVMRGSGVDGKVSIASPYLELEDRLTEIVDLRGTQTDFLALIAVGDSHLLSGDSVVELLNGFDETLLGQLRVFPSLSDIEEPISKLYRRRS